MAVFKGQIITSSDEKRSYHIEVLFEYILYELDCLGTNGSLLRHKADDLRQQLKTIQTLFKERTNSE